MSTGPNARSAAVQSPDHIEFMARPVRVLVSGVELVATVLLVAEVFVLLAGVLWRYGFDRPLDWADELASTIFIWLTVAGTVIALADGRHMRMTAVVARLDQSWQRWCEAVSSLIACLFAAAICLPGITHVLEQTAIITPAMGVSDAWRAAALPVGVCLMLVISLCHLARMTSWRLIALAALTISLVAAALWLMQPHFVAMGNLSLLVFFVGLVGVCIVLGVPIGFAFGISTVAYLTLMTRVPLSIVVNRMDEGMGHQVLISIPLFILLGALFEATGLAQNLISFMGALLGGVRGGLQYVLLGAMFLVSGISGSKVADMAAIAPALFPQMKARGVESDDLAALLSASGAMTETIAPSLVLITIGVACNISINALFIGGLLPAVIATAAIGLVCWKQAKAADFTPSPRVPLRSLARALVLASPALALPLVIRTAVVEGVATATEVSTIGVLYTLIVLAISRMVGRTIDYKRLYRLAVEAAVLSGALLFIIGMATAMSWALTSSGFSTYLVSLMRQVPGGSIGFLLVTIACFVILGSVLEGIPAIVLFGPLLFPVARALQINDVHYAMVVILAMGIGLFAPPLGVGFYSACAIGGASSDGASRKVWQYLFALSVAVLVVAFVPWISTAFLPQVMH